MTIEKAVPSSTPTIYYGHGPGGLFSTPATEKPLLSALVLPRQGLLGKLPVRATDVENPLYGIITGQTATTGTSVESTMGPCDDYPVAGLLKLCQQTAPFGLQGRMSRVFNILRMGRRQDRADPMDLEWVGNPFQASDTGAAVPTSPVGIGGNAALRNEAAKAFLEMGVAWSRDFAAEVFSGNPTSNSTGGGRKYFRGLDLLINTGYRDAITGTACARADSMVLSLGNANITTTAAAQTALFKNLTALYRQVNILAADAGLDPATWAFVMHPEMFYEITEFWPVSYATARGAAQFTTSLPLMSSPDRINDLRDSLRGDLYNHTGQYLLIDGQRVPVILDSSVVRTSIGSGVFSSSIYLVPLTVRGGFAVTYLEYLSYSEGPEAAAAAFGVSNFYSFTDNGRFAWHWKAPTNFCVQFLAVTEPRIILRTPYLAARYTNIRYTPTLITPDWNPSGPSYVDGGGTDYLGYGPSYYSATS